MKIPKEIKEKLEEFGAKFGMHFDYELMDIEETISDLEIVSEEALSLRDTLEEFNNLTRK